MNASRSTPRARIRLAVALVAALALGGCLTEANDPEGAKRIAAEWHEAFRQERWDDLLALYDPAFFREHTKRQWRAALAGMKRELGVLRDIRPVFMQKDPRFSGEFYIMGFRLQFENGAVRETMTVLHPVNEEGMRITGHLIETPKGRL
ncbi:MAG: hypothetical protein R8K47_03910 [Mariprofundaceae bacterium]